MYKYSVIIPIYNAEATLNRCVDSILAQNCENVEVILINDGSLDRSGIICEQYACNNSQVKYISQENSGVSKARNNGILAASGKYILFVDSDDYVSENYFYIIDQAIEERECDLLQFSHIKINGKNEEKVICSPFYSEDRDQVLQKLSSLICLKTINPPWGKVYKREIIEKYKIDFTVGVSIAEDRAFNIKYLLHIKSFRMIDVPLYYVSLDNVTSLSRGKKACFEQQAKIVRADIDKAIAECELSADEKKNIIDALNFGECRVAYTYAKMFWQANEKRNFRIKKIKQLCRDINSRQYSYPRTRYCRLITLPIRLEMAWLIDIMAWKLTH